MRGVGVNQFPRFRRNGKFEEFIRFTGPRPGREIIRFPAFASGWTFARRGPGDSSGSAP